MTKEGEQLAPYVLLETAGFPDINTVWTICYQVT